MIERSTINTPWSGRDLPLEAEKVKSWTSELLMVVGGTLSEAKQTEWISAGNGAFCWRATYLWHYWRWGIRIQSCKTITEIVSSRIAKENEWSNASIIWAFSSFGTTLVGIALEDEELGTSLTELSVVLSFQSCYDVASNCSHCSTKQYMDERW